MTVKKQPNPERSERGERGLNSRSAVRCTSRVNAREVGRARKHVVLVCRGAIAERRQDLSAEATAGRNPHVNQLEQNHLPVLVDGIFKALRIHETPAYCASAVRFWTRSFAAGSKLSTGLPLFLSGIVF